MEDKQEALVLDDALIIQQTRQSLNWCTECDVYIILVTIGDRRVYVTTSASNYNQEISTKTDTTAVILRNQIECYSYTVLERESDLVFTVENYQGYSELFIASLY
jgi:hypothetical protein